MKSMKDRKMDMRQGGIDEGEYFPTEAKHKVLPSAGQIKEKKYPDTEEAILADQKQFVSMASKAAPKADFRH